MFYSMTNTKNVRKAAHYLDYTLNLSEYNIYTGSCGPENNKVINLRVGPSVDLYNFPFLNNRLSLYIPFIWEGYPVKWIPRAIKLNIKGI